VTSKELPDLVRSSLPGNTTSSYDGVVLDATLATPSKASLVADVEQFQTRSVIPPLKHPVVVSTIPAEFSVPVDHCGAIDLTAATARRIVMSLMVGRLGNGSHQQWVTSSTLNEKTDGPWSSEVLDLSCKISADNGDSATRFPSLPRSTCSYVPNMADKRKDREQPRRRTNDKKSRNSTPSTDQSRLRSSTLQSSPSAAVRLGPTAVTSQGVAASDNNSRTTVDVDNQLRWGVRDVIEFVSEVPGCQIYAEVCLHYQSALITYVD